MPCIKTKVKQTIWTCISGTRHHGTAHLWDCSETVDGITFTWTEWIPDSDWVDTEVACDGQPSVTPLSYTQVAIIASNPTQQRLHQYMLEIDGIGPQAWVGWLNGS